LQDRFYAVTPHDKGTLFQLKQVINRTSFGKVPKHNMKAAEDFLNVVLCAHVTTAAEQVIKDSSIVSPDCKVIAESIVNITIPTSGDSSNGMNVDSVHAYATDFLTMALLWHGFHDAIKMGDGNRIVTYWKFLTAVFNHTGHCNYAKEGFVLLAQCSTLSPRQIAEIKWSRTVNTHGRPGSNIPVDLHLEHLNRRLKGMLRGLGSNISPQSVRRASMALGVIETVCTNFETVSAVAPTKDYHSMPSFEKDLQKLHQQLSAEEIFQISEGRSHQGFRQHKQLMASIDWEKTRDWAKKHALAYDTY